MEVLARMLGYPRGTPITVLSGKYKGRNGTVLGAYGNALRVRINGGGGTAMVSPGDLRKR
jgi:ribosomal protein L21E